MTLETPKVKAVAHDCRYLFQHGYNISLVDLVDKIATPIVKDVMMTRTYKKLDSYPTPADYTLALNTCVLLLHLITTCFDGLLGVFCSCLARWSRSQHLAVDSLADGEVGFADGRSPPIEGAVDELS